MDLFSAIFKTISRKLSRKELGISGEALAVKHLKRHGHRVLAQNFRCRQGEIDIITLDKDTVCFVEVKTRQSLSFGSGLEAVSFSKQKKLTHTALYFLQGKGWEERPFRFDVVSIFISDKKPQIEYISDAFELD